MEFRVMTYNIQHGLDYNRQLAGNTGLSHEIDLTQIAGVIRSLNPDVVGLNEVRGLGPQWDYTAQAETLAAMLGWHCYFAPAIWFEGEYPYGNAILSRRPLLSAQRILSRTRLSGMRTPTMRPGASSVRRSQTGL